VEQRRRTALALGWLAVVVAVLYLAWWGVLRGATQSGDLAVGYGAGAAWLGGADPYAVTVLQQHALAGGADQLIVGQLETLRNVYFPTTLPSFVPLAPLSWTAAKLLVLLVNLVAAGFIAWGLVRLLGWRRSEPRTLGLVAFVLALAPLHTTMAIGQVAILTTAAIVAAMLLERSGRPIWAGVFYGVAIVLKVQIGLPFLVYLAWRRRWATAAVAAAVPLVATVVAVLRMEAAGVPWYRSWMDNLALLSAPGGINDPGPLNDDRYSLVNLQYLLQSVGIRGLAADVITLGAVAIAALALVTLVRGRELDGELLVLSGVAVLTLLVTYHRYYDAVLLALPIAWGIVILRTRPVAGIVVLVLSANFLFPFQTALHDLQQRGVLPAWLTTNPLWDTVLMTQHVWALVLLVAALLWVAWDESRPRHEPRATEPAPA
jgi:hypothetical protein